MSRALVVHALSDDLSTLKMEDRAVRVPAKGEVKVRLRAAQWLAGEAEKSGKLEEEARKLRVEDVRKIEEILAAAERADEAGEDAPPARSVAGLLEEICQAPPMEAEVTKVPAPQVGYIEKLVSKPGHFPPKFVKIAV